MIQQLKDYFSAKETICQKEILSSSKKKRDKSRGKKQALSYWDSICSGVSHEKLIKKIKTERIDVFYNKLYETIYQREEDIWIEAIKEFETIRAEIKSIIDNGGRDRGTQQTK